MSDNPEFTLTLTLDELTELSMASGLRAEVMDRVIRLIPECGCPCPAVDGAVCSKKVGHVNAHHCQWDAGTAIYWEKKAE